VWRALSQTPSGWGCNSLRGSCRLNAPMLFSIWRRSDMSSSNSLRGKTAIVGIGNTRRWQAPDRSAFDQLQEAAILALEDCGLTTKDVDGLFCAMSTSGLPVLNVAEKLGLKIRHADGTMVGGASFVFHLQSAMAALHAG